jgi:hypothetical protein
MLTSQTQVEYALLEARRDPSFHQFCIDRLNPLRERHNLPEDLEACLAIEVSPGAPLARWLLELYMSTLDGFQQWIRARDLADRPLLTVIPAR